VVPLLPIPGLLPPLEHTTTRTHSAWLAPLCCAQGPLVVYNAHLEVFCGLLARIAQLSDIFADARLMADRGLQHQAILGVRAGGWVGCLAGGWESVHCQA